MLTSEGLTFSSMDVAAFSCQSCSFPVMVRDPLSGRATLPQCRNLGQFWPFAMFVVLPGKFCKGQQLILANEMCWEGCWRALGKAPSFFKERAHGPSADQGLPKARGRDVRLGHCLVEKEAGGNGCHFQCLKDYKCSLCL